MNARFPVPSPSVRGRELLLALACLLLLPLALVGPSLLPGARFLPLAPVALEPLASEHPEAAARAWRGVDFLASDALFPLLTDAERMRAALHAGELPLWDPTCSLGAPLFAQSMFGALYPPHWLAFALEPAVAFGWLALLALVLAGLGLYLFARRLGLSHGAALVGAVVYQTAGFAVANLHDLMKVEAGLWLPWMLWGAERVLAGERRAALHLGGAVALAWLAGFAPIAAFCTLAAGTYALVRGLAAGSGPGAILRAEACTLLGFALAALQWVPTREAFLESTRGERTVASAHADGLPLAANFTLVAPDVFGRADEPVFAPSNAGAWWLARAAERDRAFNANLLEWNLFAGALALALAAAAVAARPRAAAFPLALALGSLGFAEGWTGLAWLASLPGLDLGSPARAGVLAWCAWAWLAALGAEALLRRERRTLAAPLACAAFLLLGIVLFVAGNPERWVASQPDVLARRFGVAREVVQELLSPEALAAGALRVRAAGLHLAAFAALGCLATLGVLLQRRRPAWAPAWLALFAVLAAEGAWYARAHVAPRAVSGPLWPASPALDAVRAAAGDGRVLRLDESESGVAEVLDLARPNLPAAYGVADLSPYVVFTPRRAVDVWTAADPRARWRSGASRVSSVDLLDHPALDVLRVTAIVAGRPLAHPRLEPTLERERFFVYRRTGVPARARVVTTEIRAASEASALAVIAGRLADPARAVVVPASAAPFECPGGEPTGSVVIADERAGRIEIRATGVPRGWLVLADAWYPGWRATLDGREASVVPVDHALRGVAAPAGDHVLVFEYAPASLRRGAWLSALAAAGLLLLARGRRAPARVS